MKHLVLPLLATALLGLIVGCGSSGEATTVVNEKTVTVTEEVPVKPKPTPSRDTTKPKAKPKPVESASVEEPPVESSGGSASQENALESAETYLEASSFSESGLVEQLKFEGFSSSDAEYAAANVGANWNEQAVKSAETYLEASSFSESGLIEQLEFEGFTSSQAHYGASKAY